MAGKVKIRTVSNFSIVVTILLSVLCLGISLFGIQKYTVRAQLDIQLNTIRHGCRIYTAADAVQATGQE